MLVLFSFLSILLGGGLVMEYVLYRNTQQLVYDKQADWHYRHTQKNELIFMGNSRIYNHIDIPSLISHFNVPMYGLCQNARQIDFLLYKFKEYLKRNPPPKVLVVQLDPLFLLDKSLTKNTLFAKEKYLSYMFADNLGMNHLINRENGFHWYETVVPLIRYIHYPDLFKKHWNKEYLDPYGTTLNYGTMLLPYDSIHTLINLKKIKKPPTFFRERLSFRYLDTLVTFCKAQHIQVVGIYPPQSTVSYAYTDAVCPGKPQAILAYAQKHHIPYVNFNGPEYMNDSLFNNHMHLNKRGTAVFTKQLIHFLDSIQIQQYWNNN